MSATPPPPPAAPPPPPAAPPPPPQYAPPPPLPQYPVPEGRSVSFFVALFLALLLLISGGANIVLLFYSAIGGTMSMAEAAIEDSDAGYRVVAVSGPQGATDRILRIRIEGAIAEGASPMMGAMGSSVSQVRRNLRLAAKNDAIKGVLLEINSPGGGVTDSDEIYRLIKEFRSNEKKPVIAYFGDMSASGGYYIAAACDKIYCRPTTITGSIGVIMSSYNLTEAFKHIGIKSETIISPDTPYKDIMSMSRDMRPEEREILLSIIQEMYDRFVDIVDAGRPDLDRDAVKKLANGQIYSANQAKENGLVDDILDPDEVIEKIKEIAGAGEVQVVEQRRLPSLMETLFGTPSMVTKTPSLADTAARYLNQTTGSKFLYFWPGGR
jgi:protease-4